MNPFHRFLRSHIGAKFEALAQHFLECQQYHLIAKNFRCWQGEIDLIMTDKTTLAFIEVRYRQSQCYGSPLASIDQAKQRRIIATATVFLKQNRRYRAYPYRFDAVLIGPDYLQWLKYAF